MADVEALACFPAHATLREIHLYSGHDDVQRVLEEVSLKASAQGPVRDRLCSVDVIDFDTKVSAGEEGSRICAHSP